MEKINIIQNQIIDEFEVLEGDLEMAAFFIMDLGQKLPEMPKEDKTDQNLIKGCQSKVWLTAKLEKGKVYFQGDSNAAITKGLISLLIRVYSGQPLENVISSELYFIERIGLNRFIGTQRSNGFAAMIKQMKLFALALKSKVEAKL